ncbi:Nnf1-domain-containing protein [Lasiosphaeria hispida]|uniref:Nnf1-domain-containing protein n=1 Tax=Lasiosphaeria hispida TaxID=260671 RepID=A0AAJ0HLE2_9PEZI|nr:Nnf1-domain-containing protein [Lasiosphaeria hispida]
MSTGQEPDDPPPPPSQAQAQTDTTPQPPPAASETATSEPPAAAAPREDEAEGPDADAPDSPPLPPKHTAVTPGPRAARLEQLFGSTLRHTLDKVSRDNFGACFPTVAARAPGTLEFVQRQMVDRLRGLCEKEFTSILQSRAVVPKLNELESLLSDAARRKQTSEANNEVPIPPHTLPADAVLAAHLAPHLAAQQSQLNARLQNVQADNVRLFDDIQAQRAEIEALLSAVESVLVDMDGASALLDDVVDDLAQETRTAEMEMSGT